MPSPGLHAQSEASKTSLLWNTVLRQVIAGYGKPAVFFTEKKLDATGQAQSPETWPGLLY
jgi:hypothetical protein